MELWLGALNLGFLYAFMAMGVFITFRIFRFPDITVDGSFTAGAGTASILIVSGIHPLLAVLAAFAVGFAAGCLTAFIHTRFDIDGLLAGILVMTGLYSVNLHIMGRSNVPLLEERSLFDSLHGLNPGIHAEIWIALCLAVLLGIFWVCVSLFFRTDLGLRMRATGDNPAMAASVGIHVKGMVILGVALANGMVGVSGALVAQYEGFADIGMGIGTIVVGMASVIIGESLLRSRSIFIKTCSAIVGSMIFRFIIALALYAGMDPVDLKLLTAAFVLATLIVSRTVARGKLGKGGLWGKFASLRGWQRAVLGFGGAALLAGVIFLVTTAVRSPHEKGGKVPRIGVVQVVDNGLLNVTRDSFLEEMERIGYIRGETCLMDVENANGELPMVGSILDRFLMDDVDVVVTISTPCTQAAIQRIKDRPVVFATIANPFIIGAGTSEEDHLPNVTGVYGWVPMDETLRIVRRIFPGELRVGSIWDPAHANSVFNVTQLQDAVATYDDVTFEGATVTGSAEVHQAALSLAARDIDIFILCPDNTVYSAFDAVLKAAAPKKIPINLSEVGRLEDGAFLTYGYDYTVSGIQAAHMVDRILKGESPAGIPFERYEKISLGLNLDVAEEYGIEIPMDILDRATLLIEADER